MGIRVACTPGVHAPEETGGNRRQRRAPFTIRMAVEASGGMDFLRFNSPLAHRREATGPRSGAISL